MAISRSSIPQQITKGGAMAKDACYRKVKARYKVFPSAYASGAIAKCRKVGAKNWGTGGKSKTTKRKSSSSKRKGKTY